MVRRSATLLRHNLELSRAAVSGLVGALKAVDPLAVLDRGYAVVRRADDGSLVRSVRQVRAGDGLQVRVSDGTFPAEAKPRRKA
jgi:exodeoxyribonuclease VII large subunit